MPVAHSYKATSPPAANISDNSLLRCLHPESLERLRPKLKSVDLRAEEVLYQANDHITHIYFPTTAVLCMLTIMKDGRTVESATVGNEGASWVSASLGTPTMPCQTMVAVAGSAHKIAAKYVEREIRQNGLFHDLVTEYSHALLISSLRTGACNSLHNLTQRSSRWLLMTLDRTSTVEFAITHDFLSALLACSRTALTTILGELEAAGGIHTKRGRIELADRKKLEQTACECYGTIRENYEELKSREARLPSDGNGVMRHERHAESA
jgi:CRP-like cAMP-binding protein